MTTFCCYRRTICCAGLLAGLVLAAPEAQAQARPVAPVRAAAGTPRERVEIKKIEGLAQAARIKTPEYEVSTSESKPQPRDWARIMVQLETFSEWCDELELRYFVQVQHPATKIERRFLGAFTYVDIPKGKKHLSCAFLHPNTLARYGDVIGVAVEIYSRGELVASSANPEGPGGWWRTATIKEVPGLLLERSQTPFAFVAYDAYLAPKTK